MLTIPTTDLAPEVQAFEFHSCLEFLKCVIKLHALFLVEGLGVLSQVLEVVRYSASFHLII